MVAEESGPVYQAKNDGVAYRVYWSLVLENHAEKTEFKLFCIGVFDSETGKLEAHMSPREVLTVNAQEVVKDESL